MSPAEERMPTPDRPPLAHVLVVEDEVLLRMSIAEALRASGYRVAEAANGDEAQALLLAGLRVDVIFSDIRMPGALDGVALAQWVFDNGIEAHVLLTSGEDAALKAARERCVGVKAFMPKPYQDADVIALIQAALNPF